MVHAKRGGGDRVEVFKPAMRAPERSDRLALEGDLRRALDRGEIKVTYRPVVRLEDRTIAGFEALLRWDHPRLGRLAPHVFMPVAEETGLVVALGVYALEQAGRELAAWQGRWRSSRRSSPSSTCPAASSCATTSCTT